MLAQVGALVLAAAELPLPRAAAGHLPSNLHSAGLPWRDADHLPANLLLPKFPAVWALNKSTMIQTCQAPQGSSEYLREWGVASYDWSNANAIWHADEPNDCDVKMVDQAAVAKATAPDTKIWIYRNLAQAYAEFQQIREKLEDPQYDGWFLKFGPNNDEHATPRCTFNKRLNKSLCSDLFHWKGQRPGGDCGDTIPCGWYVWDHRNASLRTWLVEEFMMGKRFGLGNESVDGYLIDDWWTLDGPTEVDGFFGGTNLPQRGSEIADIYSNWSVTTHMALSRIVAAGGFTWNNVNCELDHVGGYGGLPESMAPCGLVKTEGYPQADNLNGTPTRAEPIDAAREPAQCAAWHRAACTPSSILPKVPLLLSFTRNTNGRQFPLPSPLQDIASFLLVRGPYAWMGYGWLGCISDYERPTALDYDYGTPVDTACYETAPGSNVFTRRWTKATVTLDCNTWQPNITLAGHDAPIPVPVPPASAPTPPPTPAPPAPTPAPVAGCPAPSPGFRCYEHRCSSDAPGIRPAAEVSCGSDVCYPSVQNATLCSPLPLPHSSAVKEAAARCRITPECKAFAIFGTGSWPGPPGCQPDANQTCAKFFTLGSESLTSGPGTEKWTVWVDEE